MKKRLLFGIVGCGVLVGSAIYWMIKSAYKDSGRKYTEELSKDKDTVDISPAQITDDNAIDLDTVKMRSANIIYDRHKAAAQVAKETMEKIYENTELPSKHKDEFDSLSEELDTLAE